ncbi:MAG TPA: transcription-repair coupling factor [Gemmatimonadales bacterium]|jgi:transcription-repair coupling factor (superfamily II helicase)|nr:transcription-repair coupling factor [Gemmatimonadales bacterium]
MPLDFLLEKFDDLPATRFLIERLPPAGKRVGVGGLPGSSPAVLVAALARRLPQRVFAIVAPTPADGERWLADLQMLLGAEATALYPQRESLGAEEPHYELAGERIETLEALLRGAVRVLITTARASAERTAVPAALEQARVVLEVSKEERRLTETALRLDAMGYERVPTVTEVAQYSVRGGILDVYGFGMAAPARIEWWGDEIVSVRSFDLDTQRSGDALNRVTVLPVRAESARDAGVGAQLAAPLQSNLLDLLPTDTVVVLDQESAVDREVERAWTDAAHHLEVARRMGEEPPPREELLVEPNAWRTRLAALGRLALSDAETAQRFPLAPPEHVDRDLKRLRQIVAEPPPTVILCDNEGQLERLEELLGTDRATLAVGALDGGFITPTLRVLTDHEIFRRARRLRRPRRYRSAVTTAASRPLTPGGYVVHLEHGIGIYRGLQTIAVGADGVTLEVAVVEYEGGDRLNVPLYRIDQLEPYRTVGDGDAPPPRLHRLGATTWQRQRDKTRAAIRAMAAELLDLYARRQLATGFAFPPDTPWQRELESAFLYEDTPDQRRASDEVKRDMERARPMDRLLVGDVGYGKTEVAVRAAFKAVQAGKQVVVLVPTTILAEQHGRTFRERLADYPVRIDVLSRFRSAKETTPLVQRLSGGELDIVIGTHRLLSADVTFKDLGLLIVDEEHRFGVRHKERLKTLKLSVDVLTLTATPIPRTLHLSLAGLRDLALLETAPKDRSPVLTFVEPWDDALLEEAMARELDRGGQVYFVHNRIETIDTIAARVQALAPRARLAVAHGQMREQDLEAVMGRFVRGELDVLVSTMIVESGLDVPNANTMIVDRADRFGLAQLYQLRGRVGRSHRRAFCYLLVPDQVDAQAEERLQVLEHHTDLGSGYRIALRDLELRGAGNLLGGEQSGHVQAVGFDMYLRWLEETVRGLKQGEQGAGSREQFAPPDVTMDAPAHLPDEFVADDDAKLDLYRRLARAEQAGEIQAVRDELRDRFGPLPAEAERLLLVTELRALGAQTGLETVLIKGDEARLTFRRDAAPRLAGLQVALEAVQFEADVRRAVPLSLRLRRLGGESIGPGLVRALTAVLRDHHR